jgi:hypothetical protein
MVQSLRRMISRPLSPRSPSVMDLRDRNQLERGWYNEGEFWSNEQHSKRQVLEWNAVGRSAACIQYRQHTRFQPCRRSIPFAQPWNPGSAESALHCWSRSHTICHLTLFHSFNWGGNDDSKIYEENQDDILIGTLICWIEEAGCLTRGIVKDIKES